MFCFLGGDLLRPSWDSYFIEIASAVSKRSTCIRRKVGAILVKNKRILATGYNGAPTGLSHCVEVGCESFKSLYYYCDLGFSWET